jgi:uncharacterized integral membrane protein
MKGIHATSPATLDPVATPPVTQDQVIDMAETQRPDVPDTDQIPVQADPGAPATASSGEQPTGQQPTDPNVPAAKPQPGQEHFRKVRRTRTSGMWVTLTLAAIVLLVLLVFILENGQQVNISFFGAHGHLPLGVALLLAAICGVLLVAIPGYGRILQLRRALRRSTSTGRR